MYRIREQLPAGGFILAVWSSCSRQYKTTFFLFVRGCLFPSLRRLNGIRRSTSNGPDHLCASSRSSFGSCVCLRTDLGQSQSGNSSLFTWDVSHRSTIAELAVLEI